MIIGLFLLILSFLRIQWMDMFNDVPLSHIQNGQLELQDWHASDDEVLLLDGEWEFYPSTWLFDQGDPADINESQKEFIEVPGGWKSALQDDEGEDSSFGYGSYRLRVFVDPEKRENYSLYIPSIRSASEVYLNGQLVANSGEVGTSEEHYTAKNLPYKTTFMADENGIIEIVIQAANFQDIRRSGIIRSIKFGSDTAITKQRNLSFSMQVISFVLLFVHALYAFALFFIGNRDKKLIYFSIFLLSITFMNLVSSDDKIFHLLFNISYEWDFRIANILGPIAGYSLFKCLDHRLIPYYRVINPVFLWLNIIFCIVIIFSSPEQIISLIPVNGLLTSFAMILTVIMIIRKLYIDIVSNLFLLLSFIAVAHHLVWMMYWRETGISVIHYPFDYVIAVGLFALIWFKEYFAIHTRTKKLATELQQINEQKDQFLANTSHEFKNPLHGIINMSESILIREKHLLGHHSINELETIVTVGQRMSLLLNDLLDITSLKDGNPRIRKEKMMIQSAIQGVIDMLQPSFNAKNIHMNNSVPKDFPPIFADENRVVQILYNLLHNAVKFTNEGEVQIESEVIKNRAFISVIDTGKGINEDFIQRLFVPYEQDVQSGLIDSGFGLGLNISKQLIELHGGTLDITSALGQGSTFTFSFPLASPDDEQVEDLPKEAIDSFVEPSLNLTLKESAATNHSTHSNESNAEQLSILIVDDDPINLEILQSILSVHPYDITTVLHGKEALERLNEKEWSLIITDIMMPEMSGYELTKEIRRRYSITELPILLITARSEPKDIQTGFIVGANDYVKKPIERIELLSRVNALTTLKRSVREQLHLEAIWLQAQIQPHFLFNTLNSLIALSMKDVKKMGALLMDFSNFLRSKYQFQNIDGLIPIKEELQIVKSYLNIEQVRFGSKLEVDWQIDTCKEVKVPFLSIQPLVENAINHGVMKKNGGGKITIRVSQKRDGVIISVADTGVGIDPQTLRGLLKRRTDDHSGIGLINVNQRVLRILGTEINITSEVDQGTTVSFIVP